MVLQNKKKSLLIINQYYHPDLASTGQLLKELCEGLSHSFQVTALVGTPSYSVDKNSRRPAKDTDENGVRVIRAWNTRFGRDNILGRLLNYFSFMLLAGSKALLLPKSDAVIVMSDPPTVNFIGYLVKKTKGSVFLQICQDVYPEIAVKLGNVSPFLLKIFSVLNKISQRSCDRLIAISEGMKTKLVEKGLPAEKIHVIENWIDTDSVTPEPKSNPFSQKYGLERKFTVMHSGNIGLSQNLGLLIETAEVLKDKSDIEFVLIGEGASKKDLLKMTQAKMLNNVRFLPYQEKDSIKYSLSSADLHYISLKSGLYGYIVPSKIFGIMAAARPVIACLDPKDELAKNIEEIKFGMNVKPDPNSVAKGILYFYNNSRSNQEWGLRGRKAVLERNSRAVILKSYKEFIDTILADKG